MIALMIGRLRECFFGGDNPNAAEKLQERGRGLLGIRQPGLRFVLAENVKLSGMVDPTNSKLRIGF